MGDRIADIEQIRREKRRKRGWTLEEIKKRAAEERERMRKEGSKEPDDFASGGDMSKINEESEEDSHDR